MKEIQFEVTGILEDISKEKARNMSAEELIEEAELTQVENIWPQYHLEEEGKEK